MAFQGSIKTAPHDAIHDPYSATKGLLFSHMGWIFFKPTYPRLESIERKDLDDDPVESAVLFGLVLPTALGWLWGDARGSFIWAGLIARILSPALTDWDPSKWIINLLSHFGLVYQVRRARTEDVDYAMEYIKRKQKPQGNENVQPEAHEGQLETWDGPVWSRDEAQLHVKGSPRECCFLTIEDYFVDATKYMKEHPGGAKIFRPYSIRVQNGDFVWQDATWAFKNYNYHSLMAKRQLRQLAIAKILEKEDVLG
ncbi:hypothetical protein Clacol_006906 [Clathrus columnatus]|uniref:Cytochrome b5 heme-binding domain-containing protein n=1 Tax=Clathrus columnatus TaxID=1419009 RepID=A0AAV5ADE6_9AGAM|nr:hypothetical protein Clacol_006906 [Clathrus columnatus]